METELTFNGRGSVTVLAFVYRVIVSAVLWECKFHMTLHLNTMSSPWVFGMAVLKGGSENPIVFDKYMPCISLGLSRGTNKEAPLAQRR